VWWSLRPLDLFLMYNFSSRPRGLAHALTVVCLALAGVTASAQHVHVQLSYPNNQWRLFIYDFEGGQYEAGDVPFFIAHLAFGFVPANSFTNFLGPAGSTLWTLPETENPDLPYLGIGTSGIAPGTFANNQIRLHLRSLSGPGHFALYNIDPFGTPIIHMNSRDGIAPAADSIPLSAVGGHVHVNWAFSAPGTYRVGLGASGRLANGQTNTSPVVEYAFIVQDVPWRPRLTITRAPEASSVTLHLHTEPGRTCRIESTTDFVHWEASTHLVTTSTVATLSVPSLDGTNRYFRSVILAP